MNTQTQKHADELNDLMKILGWSQRKLARYCEIEPNTANRWCNDETEVPLIVLKHLRVLVTIKDQEVK